MKTRRVVYTCPYVPAEWIAAHGFTASRIMPDSASCRPEAAFPAPLHGVCPYALAFAGAVARESADAIVVTTLCDQMRRISEFIEGQTQAPLLLMNVPKTWQTPASFELYVEEVQRLGRFLQRLGGEAPSTERLAEVMTGYDRSRSSARALVGEPVEGKRKAGVALVGGPMTVEDSWIFDFVNRSGGRIVLDATETGELGMPPPFDPRRVRDDPFDELTSAYFGGIHHPARRPNSGFHSWLKERLARTGARGIILRRYVWCDTWHIEVQRLREWAAMPLVEIDAVSDGQARVRTRTRIQSLLEMLR